MAESNDLTPAITSVGSGPRSVETDRLKAEAQPLKDLIAADRYLKAGAGSSQPSRGLRFTKLITPGPFSDQNGTQGSGQGIV